MLENRMSFMYKLITAKLEHSHGVQLNPSAKQKKSSAKKSDVVEEEEDSGSENEVWTDPRAATDEQAAADANDRTVGFGSEDEDDDSPTRPRAPFKDVIEEAVDPTVRVEGKKYRKKRDKVTYMKERLTAVPAFLGF